MIKGGRSAESTKALQRAFQWLETNHGGLPFDEGPRAEVIVRHERLYRDDLERLMKHEATGLHVKGFYPTEASGVLGKALVDDVAAGKARNWKVSTARGLESSDVSTLGAHAPYNVASSSGNSQDTDAYFDGVLEEFRDRRLLKSNSSDTDQNHNADRTTNDGTNVGAVPQLWPLDKFRLELDEAWPSGAGLAREESGLRRPFGGGLPRVMVGPTRWKKGLVHVDEMGPLKTKEGLFSANIYLQLPNEAPTSTAAGLQIWPLGVRSRWDWYRVSVPDKTGYCVVVDWNELTACLRPVKALQKIRLSSNIMMLLPPLLCYVSFSLSLSLSLRTHYCCRDCLRKIPRCRCDSDQH